MKENFADCLHYNVQEARLLIGNVYQQTEKLLLENKEKLRIVSTHSSMLSHVDLFFLHILKFLCLLVYHNNNNMTIYKAP